MLTETQLWCNSCDELESKPSPMITNWLIKPYILSLALKKVAPAFKIRILGQAFSVLYDDEAELLASYGIEHEYSFVRRVFLQDGERPLTYGRVVIPASTYEQHFALINQTGDSPFGETILYSNPKCHRSGFTFSVLSDGPHYEAIYDKTGGLKREPLWGRRSVFTLGLRPLIVTEYFLPNLPDYPESEQIIS